MAETSVAETSGMPWELSKLPNLGPGIGQYVLGTEDIFPLKVTTLLLVTHTTGLLLQCTVILKGPTPHKFF